MSDTRTVTLTEFLLARVGEDEAWADGVPPDRYAGSDWQGRVLAECEAKRRVIDAAWSTHVAIEGEWGSGWSRERMSAANDNPDAVVALGLIYADHPDDRQEWKP